MLGVGSSAIHLAVEPSAGATTFALQAARECISQGGRVLWASEEMPDITRFGQIFSSLSVHQSTLFHAMSIAGSFEDVITQLLDTMGFLPNVKLLIIDEWTPSSGKVSNERKQQLQRLVEQRSESGLLITSSMYADASGESNFKVRGGELPGLTTWKMYKQGLSKRELVKGEQIVSLILDDDGFS